MPDLLEPGWYQGRIVGAEVRGDLMRLEIDVRGVIMFHWMKCEQSVFVQQVSSDNGECVSNRPSSIDFERRVVK